MRLLVYFIKLQQSYLVTNLKMKNMELKKNLEEKEEELNSLKRNVKILRI